MNIFFLDRDPIAAARAHCDKHVVKMILETAQLLSTAHHSLSQDTPTPIYRMTHRHHPSALWVQSSASHYIWAHFLLEALCREYTYRYGRLHKTQTSGVVDALKSVPDGIFWGPFTDPPQCMPDEYKSDCTVQAYRNYYCGPKSRLATWKVRQPPSWWPASTVDTGADAGKTA